jgi:hypothetical protein
MATVTVTGSKTFVSDETVTPEKLNSLGVPGVVVALATGEVTAEKLAADAVETAKIKDENVTAAKLAATLDLSGKTLTLPPTFGLNAWATKTANYTAVAGDQINANTTGGAFTVTLPATPDDYTTVTLADHAGTWATNNLTVGRNGSNINGEAADLTCDVSAKQILLRYEGATIGWRIYT